MKIYYVRHGEPTYDENDSLTERGVYQVNEISKFLATIPFTKAFVSSLRRAQTSGEPTLKKIGITPKVVDWASEDFAWFNYHSKVGDREVWTFLAPQMINVYKTYINKENNDLYKDKKVKETKLKFINETVEKGIKKTFKEIGIIVDYKNKQYKFKNCSDKNIIIFAHQGISTFILSTLLFENYGKYVTEREVLDTASISIIDVDETTGKPTLEAYNLIKY